MGILNGNLRKTIILVISILLLAAMPVFAASKKDLKKTEVQSYFTITNAESHAEYYKIEYSFMEASSYVLASDNGIEIAEFKYLPADVISTVLAESWYLDKKGYGVNNKTTAETVVEAIHRYLDETYPYKGEVTAERAHTVFKEMVTVSLCPYQDYSIRYFSTDRGVVSAEVDYYDAIYSLGTKVSYGNRIADDFGIGMSIGTNLTFDDDEIFGNITPMFDLSAVMFRFKQFEVVSSIGFGGLITINESSLSFVPGMSATVGIQYTVDEDMVFKMEAGLDAGLWLWKTQSANGFMMAIQKPVMFGVGVRV